MNLLAMGINLWQDDAELEGYASTCGHEVRTLGLAEHAKYYTFAATETAEQVVARISREWPVDLLLCGCPETYPPPLAIEHCPVKTAAVISDWNLYQPQLEHNLARFDVVVSDLMGTRKLHLSGATPVYLGPIYSQRPQVHRDLGRTRDIDVGFFGNLSPAAHPRRTRLLGKIARMPEDYCIHFSGEHQPREYAGLLNRCRVAFNASLRGEMNLRCFEAPACGALLFIERDNEEASAVFADGETAVFYTEDDLVEKLEHYLGNEAERERIARAGQALIRGMSGVQRLDSFLKQLAEHPSGGRAFHGFDAPTRLRAEAMLCSSAYAPEQHAVAHAALVQWLAELPHDPAAMLANGCHLLDAAGWAEGIERKQLAQQAGGLFERAAQTAPEDATPWHNLGVLMAQARQPEVADRMYGRAIQAPATQLGAFALGKRSDPCYTDLRWRLALGEQAGPAVSAMSAIARARGRLQRGDTREAMDLMDALPGLRQNPQACTLAGEAAQREGNSQQAVALLRQGLEHDPFSPTLHEGFAACCTSPEQADEAQEAAGLILSRCTYTAATG
jgi:Flp pilus assembly protein TadD